MSTSPETQRVLVELDSVLDTRLGLLANIDNESAWAMIDHGYRERVSDDWQSLGFDITPEEFQELYRARTSEVLAYSRLTGIVPMLKAIEEQLHRLAEQTPFHQRIIVDLNVHPYTLTTEEKRVVAQTLSKQLGETLPIEVVSYSMEQLTPSLIATNWAAVIQYEFDRWLNYHHSALQKTPMPRNQMVVPALFANAIPSEEDLAALESPMTKDPFRAMEYAMVPLMSWTMVEPRYFSFVAV